jgi:hypothetical protein
MNYPNIPGMSLHTRHQLSSLAGRILVNMFSIPFGKGFVLSPLRFPFFMNAACILLCVNGNEGGVAAGVQQNVLSSVVDYNIPRLYTAGKFICNVVHTVMKKENLFNPQAEFMKSCCPEYVEYIQRVYNITYDCISSIPLLNDRVVQYLVLAIVDVFFVREKKMKDNNSGGCNTNINDQKEAYDHKCLNEKKNLLSVLLEALCSIVKNSEIAIDELNKLLNQQKSGISKEVSDKFRDSINLIATGKVPNERFFANEILSCCKGTA